MKPLALFAAAMLIATLAMIGIANANAPATDETPRPKPRPMMDCWLDHDTGATDCRVKEAGE